MSTAASPELQAVVSNHFGGVKVFGEVKVFGGVKVRQFLWH